MRISNDNKVENRRKLILNFIKIIAINNYLKKLKALIILKHNFFIFSY
jgi:hypothetical protein